MIPKQPPEGLRKKGIESARSNLPENARIRIPGHRFLDAFGPELQLAIKDLEAKRNAKKTQKAAGTGTE